MRNDPGRIATFYSYKGGTGRSMALANFAWILAASGKRVMAMDWDLEAPGLHRYFRPFLADPDLFETDGLIDMFWDLTVSAVQRADSHSAAVTSSPAQQVPVGDRPGLVVTPSFDGVRLASSFEASATRDTPSESGAVIEALEDATRRLDSRIGDKDFFPPGGYLDFIGAGRQGPTYSERVNSFSWKRFWELGGPRMLDQAKDYLRENYDWVLIDSRTGVSDTSGICTIHMPETVVAFFTLNRQSIEGVAAILQSIRSFRGPGVDGSEIEFFPIATRIENAEKHKLELARAYARRVLAGYLPKEMQATPRDYWDNMEIGYRPAYAFEETLAAFGDATGAAGSTDTMLNQVELTSQQITGDIKLRMPEIGERDRAQILAKYALGTSITPGASETVDTDFLRNLRTKEQLWRTSGSKWRLLLSRKELDLLTEEDRKSFGRNMGYYVIQSERMWNLLRVGQIIGSSVFLLTLLAFGVSIILSKGLEILGYLRYTPFTCFLAVLLAVIAAWLASAAARTVVAAIRDKPEGVGLLQVFLISLTGPVGLRVDDYDPAGKKDNTQIISKLVVGGVVLVLLGLGLGIIQFRKESLDNSRLAPPVSSVSLYQPTGNEGSISGTVSYVGRPPELSRIDTSADPICTAKAPNLTTEDWMISVDGRLKNTFVYVKDGTFLDGRKIDDYLWEVPPTPMFLDQQGCRYNPHVSGARAGQTIVISNNDPTVHNVHFTPKLNPEWNMSQTKGAQNLSHKLSSSEVMVPVKCNQHPWMKAYIGVLRHPFFAVTDYNGAFAIKGLPPGTYTIVAWHEGGSTGTEKTMTVTVPSKGAATADFSFGATAASRGNAGSLRMMPAIEFPMRGQSK